MKLESINPTPKQLKQPRILCLSVKESKWHNWEWKVIKKEHLLPRWWHLSLGPEVAFFKFPVGKNKIRNLLWHKWFDRIWPTSDSRVPAACHHSCCSVDLFACRTLWLWLLSKNKHTVGVIYQRLLKSSYSSTPVQSAVDKSGKCHLNTTPLFAQFPGLNSSICIADKERKVKKQKDEFLLYCKMETSQQEFKCAAAGCSELWERVFLSVTAFSSLESVFSVAIAPSGYTKNICTFLTQHHFLCSPTDPHRHKITCTIWDLKNSQLRRNDCLITIRAAPSYTELHWSACDQLINA